MPSEIPKCSERDAGNSKFPSKDEERTPCSKINEVIIIPLVFNFFILIIDAFSHSATLPF
jgi:hypothetical protein